MKKFVKLSPVLILLFSLGCWYYSFTEKPYPDIETVQIIPFDNETAEYDLADMLTSAVVNQLEGSGLLNVRNRDTDSDISGRVVSIDRTVHSYTAGEIPEEYKVTISAQITFRDINKDRTMWEGRFVGFGIYPALEDDREAIEEALAMLVQRIIQRLRDG